MSGGFFNYKQRILDDMAVMVKQLIVTNNNTGEYAWGDNIGRHYDAEIIEKLKETVHWLERTSEMVHRIDWLVSCDDSPKSFLRRWKKEVRKP